MTEPESYPGSGIEFLSLEVFRRLGWSRRMVEIPLSVQRNEPVTHVGLFADRFFRIPIWEIEGSRIQAVSIGE